MLLQSFSIITSAANRIALLMFFVVVIFSCKQNENNSSSSESAMKTKIQNVGVVHPEERNFTSDISIIGTALPNQMVHVHAMESGYISSINRDIGDYVTKGSVIAQLSNPELSSQYIESQARAKSLSASLNKSKAEKTKWNAMLASKKSIYERLNNTYKNAPNIVLISDVENARAEYESARANLSAAEAAIAVATAEYDAAKAVERAFAGRIGMLRIRAPFTGLITKRYMDNGATVQSGLNESNSVPIVDMQDISTIRLTLQVPESDAATINIGNEVVIDFPELPGDKKQATISRTSNTLDPESKSMQVEIDIENPDFLIKPGMYAKVSLEAQNRNGILSLPVEAKKLINDVAHILIVRNDVVEEVALRQGLVGRNYFEILNSDIDKNTQVIIQGKNLVKAGQAVEALLIKGEK